MQGFPDSFVLPVSDPQAYRQLGNSVVVPLIADVARLMVATLTQLERGFTPHQLSLWHAEGAWSLPAEGTLQGPEVWPEAWPEA